MQSQGNTKITLAELIDSADDELFHSILHNSLHVLHSTLPKETGSSYGLRRRRHNRELLNKSCQILRFIIEQKINIRSFLVASNLKD